MLIIEGSDLVGKTTLIKAICDEASERGFPMIPQHFGLLPNNWDFYGDYFPYVTQRTVMDRFILSEVVYGETLRDGSRIHEGYFKALQAYIETYKSMTVIIAAEPEFFKEHVHRQMQYRAEVFREDQICKVNDAFLSVMVNRHLNEFEIDYDIAREIHNDRDFPSSDPEFVSEIVETYLKLQGV